MKILQAGAAKSGNYWLFTIIQSILRHAGLPTHTYIETQPIYAIAKHWELSYPEQASIDTIDITDFGVSYRISSIFRWPVHDLDEYLQHATHVWTHSEFCGRSHDVLPKFDKIVYIIRDPRDMALSTARFMFTPYMRAFYPTAQETPEAYLDAKLGKTLATWRRHVTGHLAAAARYKIHVMFYERMLADLPAELDALCRYLGVEPSPELLDAVREGAKFETMQASSPGHVSKGEAWQWMHRLTPMQKARALKQTGRLLGLLNYPQTEPFDPKMLPRLPDPFDSTALLAAAQPPRTFRSMLRGAARRIIR